MSIHSDKELKEFDKWGKQRPSHQPHGLPEDIKQNMRKLLPNQWKLVGNELKGWTEMGEFSYRIPPHYICHGTDEKGLPILKKIDL